MDYRNLGRTGVKVSPLTLGCMMFGGQTPAKESHQIMRRAVDAGINFFDTANVYHRGESEKVVGSFLKASGTRERIVLATKAFGKMDDVDPNSQGSHRRHLVAACEASLRRLHTDHIDLYQIHRPNPAIPIDETLRALDDLVRAGKVLYLGTSTFAAWQLMEAVMVAKELGSNRFVCEQPPYNLLDRRIERELLPFARTYGVGIIPWAPLASGFLTGKYRRGQPAPPNSRLWDTAKNDVTRFGKPYGERAYDVAEGLAALAATKGCTPGQLALAWCMHQPGVTAPIVGPKSLAQWEDHLGALTVTVTDDDRKRLDELAPPGQVIVQYYDAEFGPHLHRV